MNRRRNQYPSPDEIGSMLMEDELGLPTMAQDSLSPAADPVGIVGAAGDQQPNMQPGPSKTALQTCSASACLNNRDGLCGLDTIEINEYGGCKQYEATAQGGDARYEETATDDVTGGDNAAAQGSSPADQELRNTNEPWDAQGSSF